MVAKGRDVHTQAVEGGLIDVQGAEQVVRTASLKAWVAGFVIGEIRLSHQRAVCGRSKLCCEPRRATMFRRT
jgi:hypothetical protein